jgi:membrane-bound lytic murein transglycosylase D
MKVPCNKLKTLLLAIMLLATQNAFASPRGSAMDEVPIEKRVQQMNSPVTPKYTTTVEEHIRSYVSYGKKDAEYMLGRSEQYFPIFEFYLERYNLPEGLKYLPVIESNLRPQVVSKAGAAGLWQIMHGTAGELGLHVNHQIDERRDPYKSTEAAVRYLSDLFEKYNNWELALAAYNCGPGNVNKAIKMARSRNFWKIRSFLPAETQNYIPRFIAANYIGEYFDHHQLEPVQLEYDLLFTQSIRIYSHASLKKIASVSRVPLATIERLNPAYKRGYIPASSKGNYLVLPELGMEAMRDYLRWSGNRTIQSDVAMIRHHQANAEGKVPVTISVESGFYSIEKLADLYNCTQEQIMAWNGLQSPQLYPNQELIFFLPESQNAAMLRPGA